MIYFVIGASFFLLGILIGYLAKDQQKQGLVETNYKLVNDLYDCKNELQKQIDLNKMVETPKVDIPKVVMTGNSIKIVLPKLPAQKQEIKESSLKSIEDFDFKDKNVVITGALESYERPDVERMVLDMGGILQKTVTLKTNVLIQGIQESDLIDETGLSRKQKKAYEYINRGIEIVILNESDFLKLIEKQKL